MSDQGCPPYPFTTEDPALLAASYAKLRTSDPIAEVRLPSGDTAYLVTRYDDAQQVLSDPRFSGNISRPEAARLWAEGGNVSSPFADPPEHTRWRRLASYGFSTRRVEVMRERVTRTAEDLADDLARTGPPADVLDAFAFPLSISVISDMLGVPPFDRRRFRLWIDATVSSEGHTAEEKMAAFGAMAQYARDLVALKRASTDDDLARRLVTAHDEDAAGFTEDELVITIMALLIGGYETSASQLAKGLLALFRHPDQLAALRADLSLVPGAVEEILRYTPADSGIGQARFATEDVEVNGILVPEGSTLLIIRQSVNHDEEHFEEPDQFDVTRAAAGRHLAFGYGPRRCIGAALARMELQAGLTVLLRRFPGLRPAVPLQQVRASRPIIASRPDSLPVTW
jgi:cytochrome P450